MKGYSPVFRGSYCHEIHPFQTERDARTTLLWCTGKGAAGWYGLRKGTGTMSYGVVRAAEYYRNVRCGMLRAADWYGEGACCGMVRATEYYELRNGTGR